MSIAVKAAESFAKLGGLIVDQNCVLTPPPPVVAASNTDVLAASIAAQSNAIAAQANNLTVFNVTLGIVAVLGLFAWGAYVRHRAERMAREQADRWMDQKAPGIIAELYAQVSARAQTTPEEQGAALARDPVGKD